MSAPPDHYSVLGVSSDASSDDVAAQARRVRTEFHPDKFSRDAAAQRSAEAAFKRASDAFEVLGDSASRAIYDRFGHEGVQEARQLGLVGSSTALALRSPAETVEKYALDRRLRKEKELAG
jgi:DnaJ-class molecular chaperone